MIGLIISMTIIIIGMIVTIFLANKATKTVRLFGVALEVGGYALLIKTLPVWKEAIGLKSVLTYLILGVFTLVLLIILKFTWSSKIKFGNHFIISFSFLRNIIDGKNKKPANNIIDVGQIVPIGPVDIPKSGMTLSLSSNLLSSGLFVTGSSGSGKTYLIKDMVKQDFVNGSPVVFFDFKGDEVLRKELVEEAEKNQYNIYSFNDTQNLYFFDPLASLNAEGKIEAIMSTRKWDISGADSHYKTNAKLIIQKYITEFEKYISQKKNDFFDEFDFPYTANLLKFVKATIPTNYNSNITVKGAYDTLVGQLELLLESTMIGPTLKDRSASHFSFKEKAYFNDNKYLLICTLPSENKELGNSITNLYLNNMISAAVQSGGFDKSIKLYIEEFGTLTDSFAIKDIIEKGRSLGISSCVSMQDIFQVVVHTNEAYLNSLLGTITNYIIFPGATKKASEFLSGVQIKDIDKLIQSLKRPNPDYNDRPTALFITKNHLLERSKSSEVYKFFPGRTFKISEVLGENVVDEEETIPGGGGPDKKTLKKVKKASDNLFTDIMEFKDLY